jgi:hypothetical protein
MIKKLDEWKGGILLFFCLLVMINVYVNRIHELNQTDEYNRIAYYDK